MVIVKPAKSTLDAANVNFSGLRMMPFWPHISSHWTARKKPSSSSIVSRPQEGVVNALGLVANICDNLVIAS